MYGSSLTAFVGKHTPSSVQIRKHSQTSCACVHACHRAKFKLSLCSQAQSAPGCFADADKRGWTLQQCLPGPGWGAEVWAVLLCCIPARGLCHRPSHCEQGRGGRPQRKCQGWRGGVNPSTFPFRVPNKCQPHGSCIGWGPSPEAAPGRWTRSMVPSSSSRAD